MRTPRLQSQQLNQTKEPARRVQRFPGSPLLPGDDEDVVEEEEVDLLPRRPLEEDAVVLHKGLQLPSLYHPPGG